MVLSSANTRKETFAINIIPLIILAMLAACAPPAPESPAPESPPAFAEETMMTPVVLIGEYRVAGVDGQDINLPHGITASISDDEIEIQSQCIRFKWTYTITDGVLAARRTPAASCQRALYPEEAAIARAFDQAVQARRTLANGIEIAGAGHSVTLFSQ